jgi:putative N6-adenine-specific DNA methylase
MTDTIYRTFLAVAPGLERLLEAEVDAVLGTNAPRVRQLTGGVEVHIDAEGLWRLARLGRLAESIRVRMGRRFPAHNFDELVTGLARLPWAAYVPRGSRPEIRVTCRRSALYHSDAVADRVTKLLAERLGPADATGPDAPRIFVRIVRDRAQVSVDASGERLHRRGYRTHIGVAPLRETLAAACLRAAGYAPGDALWDPFCGSGTLPIEALGLACGADFTAGRGYAFERWPTHDPSAYQALVETLSGSLSAGARVFGSDRDAKAIEAARHNADKAGLSAHCDWWEGDFETVAEHIPQGTCVITNPPYGRRAVGSGGEPLAALFARFGALLSSRPDLLPVHVLTGHPKFETASGLSFEPVLRFQNRGLAVSLLRLRRPG